MIISIWSLVSDKMFIKMLIEQGMDLETDYSMAYIVGYLANCLQIFFQGTAYSLDDLSRAFRLFQADLKSKLKCLSMLVSCVCQSLKFLRNMVLGKKGL